MTSMWFIRGKDELFPLLLVFYEVYYGTLFFECISFAALKKDKGAQHYQIYVKNNIYFYFTDSEISFSLD